MNPPYTGIPLINGFSINKDQPIDARFVVANNNARNNLLYKYPLMIVATIDSGKIWKLKTNQVGNLDAHWEELISSSSPISFVDVSVVNDCTERDNISSPLEGHIAIVLDASTCDPTLPSNTGASYVFDGENWIEIKFPGVTYADFNPVAALAHQQNTDTMLNSGGANQVTAAQLKAHMLDTSIHWLKEDILDDSNPSLGTTYTSTKIESLITSVLNAINNNSAKLTQNLTVELGVGGFVGDAKTGDVFLINTPLETVIRRMLIRAIPPTYVMPTLTANYSGNETVVEVGADALLNADFTFTQNNAGTIDTNGFIIERSVNSGSTWSTVVTNNNVVDWVGEPYTIPNNSTSAIVHRAKVTYRQGNCLNNNLGNQDCTGRINGGTLTSTSLTLTPVYPVFYGKIARSGATPAIPTASEIKDIIEDDNATKAVIVSTGTITLDFNSTNNDFIWFATPATSTTKTKWQITDLNRGDMGGTSDWFGSPVTQTINPPDSSFWATGVSYKIYISRYRSEALEPIQFRNN